MSRRQQQFIKSRHSKTEQMKQRLTTMESEGSIAFMLGWKRKRTRQIAFCKLPAFYKPIMDLEAYLSSFPQNTCYKAAQAFTIFQQKKKLCRCKPTALPIHPTVYQDKNINGPSPGLTINTVLRPSPWQLFLYLIANGSKDVTAQILCPPFWCHWKALRWLCNIHRSWNFNVSFHNYALWDYPTVPAALTV